MEGKCYYVYKHVFPNGKVYIGISNDPESRWNNGFGYQGNRKMFFDIVKYGWDNIDHQIIVSGLSLIEASEMERKLIRAFRKDARSKTYNTTHTEAPAKVVPTIGQIRYLEAASNPSLARNIDDDWVDEYTPYGMYDGLKYGKNDVKLFTSERSESGELRILEQTFYLPFDTVLEENATVNDVLCFLRGRTPETRYLGKEDLIWLPQFTR